MKHCVREAAHRAPEGGRGDGVTFTRDEVMRKLGAIVRRCWSDERGASLLEYSVMLAGIAVMALLAVRAFGGSTQRSLQHSASMVTEALGGESAGGSGAAASAGTSPSGGGGSPSLPGVSGSSGSNSGPGDGSPAISGSGGSPSGGGTGGHGSGGGSISVGS